MDRRSWPWKKKSSEKAATATDAAGSSLASSAGNQGDQDNSKNVNYVQISTESYAHFIELEDQAKILNEKLSLLNEKLSLAQSEMITKDNLVKQHAKVAEEAVSGWEKAEAEALALKNHLESVTLLKLTAEDRAAHLDGALKECMRQIRNVKEENEHKLQDVVFTKTKQWDKVRFELDAKVADLEQELLRSSAENTALSRSLQERSNMLMKVSEEKLQADAEIEVLKAEIKSFEKEISSLKYELHIVSKELEIRNEEKNMNLRSAEVANKQHLEGVKKITKLEAECQRLRGLVRKKLPGPAALAQMKLEVENLGRDYGESKLRRSPAKVSSPHLGPATQFSLDNIQHHHKEVEFLTARLMTMEEETKLLKEALSKRNSELQASRNMCAKTSSKLRSLEAQIQPLSQSKGPLNSNMLNLQVPIEGSLSNTSNPPSVTSMSEDGVEEEGGCSDSWAPALISELSRFKKEKNVDKVNRTDNSSHLELMDDFIEMEQFACLSADSNGTISVSGRLTDNEAEHTHANTLTDVKKDNYIQKEEPNFDASSSLVFSNDETSVVEIESNKHEETVAKLQSRIAFILESQAKGGNISKILEDMKHAIQDLQDALPRHSVNSTSEGTTLADASTIQKPAPEDKEETIDSSMTNDSFVPGKHLLDQELSKAISVIHDFMLSLGKEATEIQIMRPDEQGLCQKIEMFSASVSRMLRNEMSLVDFVVGLSHVLAEASQQILSMLTYRQNEGESNSIDCIDKVTLLENNAVKHDMLKERFSSECNPILHSISDQEILQEGRFGHSFEQKSLFEFSKEEFEQVKIEKDKMAVDLEHTKNQLRETEQLLEELKSELTACQKSNSLAETQLKCMAESYKLLEIHAQEVEKEINLLRAKAEDLETELQEEKHNLQDALARCKDLEEQVERTESCATCLQSLSADVDIKTKQEEEIAAAAEKLAECQETIFLLGKQLKALCPSSMDPAAFPHDERNNPNEDFFENAQSPGHVNQPGLYSLQQSDQTGMENAIAVMHRIGYESPSDGFIAPMSPSDIDSNLLTRSPISSKKPKHRSTRSPSPSSTSVVPASEKNARSFSRFFSRGKGIN